MRLRGNLRASLGLLLLVTSSAHLEAFVAPEGLHPDDVVLLPVEYPLSLAGDEEYSTQFAAGEAWSAFLTASDGDWEVRADKRTGLVSLASGSGIPWIPGRGNDLQFFNEPTTEGIRTLLVERSKDFMRSHPGLFPFAVEDLVLNPHRTLSVADGQVWQVSFGYAPAGRKASGASVFFRIGHGNLVQFGTRHMIGWPEVPDAPAISAKQARSAATAYLGAGPESVRFEDDGTLYLLPQAEGEHGLRYQLVWQTTFHEQGRIPRWTAIVDAMDGDLVAFYDSNSYACDPSLLTQGRVTGGVRPTLVTDDEVIRSMPFTAVDTDGNAVVTDFNGIYSYSGGTSVTTLGGRYTNIRCEGCSNPADPLVSDSVTGDLLFGTGGNNQIGNGTSTIADRTTYWHVTMARSLGARWVPDMPWFDGNLRANTNINSSCNAFYNGSINMFRAGGNCTNTGENPGVIQHEWGHGLHTSGLDYDGTLDPTPGFDGSFSEGLGDHVAWIMNHDPRVGAGFRTGGGSVRVVDPSIAPQFRTLSDSGCPGGSGYDGYQVHCGGEIWSQADWELMEALVGRYGEFGGWYMIERLFYSAVPFAETHVPNQPHSVYDVYALILDDDGDLANGIPEGDLLNTAYQAHELASDPAYAVSASACDPGPTGPVLTADPVLDPANNQYQVQLSWAAVPGANFYNVLRSENGVQFAFQTIAQDLPAAQTMFVDDTVSNLRTYEYRLQVVDGNGCVSLNDNTESAVVDLAELALENLVIADDSGNGVVTPGESADLPLEIRNLGGGAATGIEAELFAITPGVNVLTPLATYPDMQGLDLMAPQGSPFRIEVPDDQTLCGETIEFLLVISSDQGCWDSSFSVLVGGNESILEVDTVTVDDWVVGNANGRTDPEELVDLYLEIRNSGPQASPNTTVELLTSDPSIALVRPTADYGTIDPGNTGSPDQPFQIQLDRDFQCGVEFTLEVRMTSDTGCWSGFITLGSGVLETHWTEDFEFDSGTDWIVGDPSDTATAGIWERADPEGTQVQPENDHTPGAGTIAWVTGAAAGGQTGANDIDDGCTTLATPSFDMSDIAAPVFSYWRWYANEINVNDAFDVEVSEDGGQNWANLESQVGSQLTWTERSHNLLDHISDLSDVTVRFRACDVDPGSWSEALIDDVSLQEWVCEPAEPRSELVLENWQAADDIGGQGNSDGIFEPGELLTLSLDLRNIRNATAESIEISIQSPTGAARLEGAVATAPDADPNTVVSSVAPHLAVRIDPFGQACFDSLPLDIVVTYTDTAMQGATRTLVARVNIPIGGVGPLEQLFFDDFEGPDDNGWVHGATAGNDEWARGTPMGQQEDPGAAVSGVNVWGTDLGDGTNGRYPSNVNMFLESPPFDMTGMGAAELRYQRWLAVEDARFDQARVVVDGTVAWQNPTNTNLVDTAWVPETVALPASIDGQSGIQVRFELITDGGLQLGGWNIDDFEFWAAPRMCEVFCAPAVSTRDALRVRRTGDNIVLDWSPLGTPTPANLYWDADPSALPPNGSPAPTASTPGQDFEDLGAYDQFPPLTFFRILSMDACGNEEIP